MSRKHQRPLELGAEANEEHIKDCTTWDPCGLNSCANYMANIEVRQAVASPPRPPIVNRWPNFHQTQSLALLLVKFLVTKNLIDFVTHPPKEVNCCTS